MTLAIMIRILSSLEHGGEIFFPRVLHKLSGGGERTIRMGGERESQVCISDRRGLACLLVGAVSYLFDSLAFLLDDTTTGQLVYST